MASFTVHVPTDGDDAFARAERTAVVRDGFSAWAFVFGPLYLALCRAWIAAALWVIVVLLGAWACVLLRLPAGADAALAFLVALFTGLEASSLRRLSLHRRGFALADVVDAGSRGEGERAFFRAATVQGLPARATMVAGQGRVPPDVAVIGLFPEAGPPR